MHQVNMADLMVSVGVWELQSGLGQRTEARSEPDHSVQPKTAIEYREVQYTHTACMHILSEYCTHITDVWVETCARKTNRSLILAMGSTCYAQDGDDALFWGQLWWDYHWRQSQLTAEWVWLTFFNITNSCH